jgi:hypothetical protein
MTELTKGIEAQLRALINPQHANRRGSKSWERAMLFAEIDRLRDFASAVMESWPTGDVDGGELQEAAAKYGLLEEKDVTCGENCQCQDCGVDFPTKCFSRVWWMDNK